MHTQCSIHVPFSSLTVAYWELASGHEARLHRPVRFISFRQNSVGFVLKKHRTALNLSFIVQYCPSLLVEYSDLSVKDKGLKKSKGTQCENSLFRLIGLKFRRTIVGGKWYTSFGSFILASVQPMNNCGQLKSNGAWLYKTKQKSTWWNRRERTREWSRERGGTKAVFSCLTCVNQCSKQRVKRFSVRDMLRGAA